MGRLPVLVALGALLLGALFIDQRVAIPDGRPSDAVVAAPVAATADATSSVWYCAASAPAPEIQAAHTVLVANTGDAARRAKVTFFPGEGEPVTTEVALPAHGRTEIPVADHVGARFASAMVEADGGLVSAAHRLEGPAGSTTAPCGSSASPTWYFPAGSAQNGTRAHLVLFNPFAGPAVVDVGLQVQEDSGRQVRRTPPRLDGLIIPARRSVVLDLTADAGGRLFTAQVSARDGAARIVAERVLSNDGSAGAPRHLSATLGAPEAASAWAFADGRPPRAGVSTTFVLFNPNTAAVQVELRLRVDRYDVEVPPFLATVQPGEIQALTLDGDQRVPVGEAYWAVAVAKGPGTFVIERVTRADPSVAGSGGDGGQPGPDGDDHGDGGHDDEGTAPTTTTTTTGRRATGSTTTTTAGGRGSGPTARPTTTTTRRAGPTTTTTMAGPRLTPTVLDFGGVSHTMGSPLLGPEWLVVVASVPAGGAANVSVANLTDRPVKLTIFIDADGRAVPVPAYNDVVVESGLRTSIDLGDAMLPGGSGERSLRIRADGPVLVEAVSALAEPRSLNDHHAVPVGTGLVAPSVGTLAVAVPPAAAGNPSDPTALPGGGDETTTTSR